MLVSELITQASAVDPGLTVKVVAPFNPVLNTILGLGLPESTSVDVDGNFLIVMSEISTTFRISAPYDTALSETLEGSNILGVDTTSEPGTSHFQIDT